MRVTNFKSNILDNAVMLSNGSNPFSDVYSLKNDRVFKVIKFPTKATGTKKFDRLYDSLCDKLKNTDSLSCVPHLAIPDEVSVDTDGKVIGFYRPYVEGKKFDELVESNNNQEFITQFFIDLCDAVDNLHGNHIIVPDLFDLDNILYDPETRSITFTDPTKFQIGNNRAPKVSEGLHVADNSVLRSLKYLNFDGLFTEELDKLSLALSYFYNLTGYNLLNKKIFQQLDEDVPLDEMMMARARVGKFLVSIGVDKNDTDTLEGLRNPFCATIDNDKPQTLIKRINDNYTTIGLSRSKSKLISK